jgi:hypothetical protein
VAGAPTFAGARHAVPALPVEKSRIGPRIHVRQDSVSAT